MFVYIYIYIYYICMLACIYICVCEIIYVYMYICIYIYIYIYYYWHYVFWHREGYWNIYPYFLICLEEQIFWGREGRPWPFINCYLAIRSSQPHGFFYLPTLVCLLHYYFSCTPRHSAPFFSKGRVPAGQFSRYFQRKRKEGVDWSINCYYLANRSSQPQARQFSVCRRWLACLLHYYFSCTPLLFFLKKEWRVPAGHFPRYFQREKREGVESINCYLAIRSSQPHGIFLFAADACLSITLLFFCTPLLLFSSKKEGYRLAIFPDTFKGKGRKAWPLLIATWLFVRPNRTTIFYLPTLACLLHYYFSDT